MSIVNSELAIPIPILDFIFNEKNFLPLLLLESNYDDS